MQARNAIPRSTGVPPVILGNMGGTPMSLGRGATGRPPVRVRTVI